MLKITLVAVGALKNSALRELAEEYLKRLRPYAKIDLLELVPEPFYATDQKEKAKQKEGERIEKALTKYADAHIYLLDEGGKEFSSLQFAEHINTHNSEHAVFVIAGALGWSNMLRNSRYQKLSLSAMTFPHEFARVVLLEQLYRAVSIIQRKEYHY